MNKYIFSAFWLSLFLLVQAPVCVADDEIPGYIVDIERPYKNIDSIIEALTSSATGMESAIDDAELQNIMLRKLASALYAEAITTRTNLLKSEKEKAAKQKKNGFGAADDKKEILSDEVQPMLRSIAERLNSIVSMEAGLANLEGTMALSALPKINSDIFVTEEDVEGAQ